jgi:hypothetical protein
MVFIFDTHQSFRPSWHFVVDCAAGRGRRDIIHWWILGQLIHLSPAANLVKVLAPVMSVEVEVWLWVIGIYPDLSQYPGVYCAHELLPNDI